MATPSELIAALRNLKNGQANPYKSAADLIDACGAEARDKFLQFSVDEAAKAGISIEFGGYAIVKDKYGKDQYSTYAHTISNTIFMPHPSVRTLTTENAITWFLFETRNAMRAQKYCQLHKEVANGFKDKNQFIYFMAEYEVRGGLEVGQLWSALIAKYQKSPTRGQSLYLHNLYTASPNWATDPGQLSKAMENNLNTPYDSGSVQDKTRRQAYGDIFPFYAVTNKAYFSTKTCTGSNLNLIATTTELPVGLA
jgi:hypothetical protein